MLLALLLTGCTTCDTPAHEGTVTVLVGEDEYLRAAGKDGVVQDSECRTMCAAFAPSLDDLTGCTSELAEEGDAPFDTAGAVAEPRYTVSCAGSFYCL